MAHNLNINKDGKASFAAVGTAWHGLGVVLDEKMTADKALELAGLDYDVVKVPTLTEEFVTDDGSVIDPLETGYYSTVRTDTKQVLGNAGERYSILQNKDAFGFFDPIIDRDEAIYETAGALGNGERIFLTAKMPDHIELSNGDLIDQYIVFDNSHDGSASTRAMVTPVRVVCNNTLAAAIKANKASVSIRHTANMKDRLKEAHKILNLSSTLRTEIEELSNLMIKTSVNDKKTAQIMDAFFLTDAERKKLAEGAIREELLSTRKQNMISDCNEFYMQGIGQANVIGSVWGVYNALTGWSQHVKKASSDSVKLKNVLWGNDKNKALQVALSAV